MWRFKGHGWVLFVFAIAWVSLVTLFTWELVTQAGRLDRIVRYRTDALEASNRQLAALLEQLNAFHRISYEINQRLELRDITRAFTDQTYRMFPQVNGVWLWLDPDRVHPDVDRTCSTGQKPVSLRLMAQCGRDFGLPKQLKELRPDNPLVAACFAEGGVSVSQGLSGRAKELGWQWLAKSPMTSFAAIPLRLGDALLGMLGVFSKQELPSEFLRQLHLSANQFTMALEKARLLRHVQRRADQLAAANEKLRQLDAMKDWFISSVSHELRTPLTSIRSFSEILEGYEDLEPRERIEFARIIRDESERLSEMIGQMLDLAKLAGGDAGMQAAAFDVKPLVSRCCRLFSQQAEERDIEFALELPDSLPQVFAQEMGVARVLNNLLGNALKFTADGGKIEVHVQAEKSTVTVTVRDNGIGIAPTDQLRVFDRFTQVGSQLTDKPPGAGIGLAICRELVESWNGRIWLESEPGKGSAFAFTLPAAEAVGHSLGSGAEL
jgi:signal transduction histidine kinase